MKIESSNAPALQGRNEPRVKVNRVADKSSRPFGYPMDVSNVTAQGGLVQEAVDGLVNVQLLPLAGIIAAEVPGARFPVPERPVTLLLLPFGLVIYDALGRTVRTLVNSSLAAGKYRAVWNGTDDSNLRLAPGVYFCALSNESGTETQKLILNP